MRAPSLSARAAGAAVLVGGLGAIALVGGSPGIGFPLTAVALAAALGSTGTGWPRTVDAAVCGGLALILSAMAAVRDAGWVVGIDLLAALSLGIWAVSGISTWRSLLTGLSDGLMQWLLAPLRVGGVLGATMDPARRQRLRPVLRGSLVGIGLVVVFGTLFVTADSAFAQITSDLLPQDWDARLWPARVFVAVAVTGLAAGLMLIVGKRSLSEPTEERDPFAPDTFTQEKARARSEWIVPLALLDALFVAFVVVQIAVLFGGRDHVLDTANVTYAEYARTGFFQLLAVAFLTLLVIVVAVQVARPAEGKCTLWLQILLGILCACTLVILASAFLRLKLYEETYGFTRLRIGVHATILWLAALFGLVVGAGIKMKGTWLPRSVVRLTAVALVTFSLVDPDRFIAERNVERYETTGKLDLDYLSSLSADAVPALVELPTDELGCLLPTFEYRLSMDEPLMSSNLARSHARALLQREGAQPEDCAP